MDEEEAEGGDGPSGDAGERRSRTEPHEGATLRFLARVREDGVEGKSALAEVGRYPVLAPRPEGARAAISRLGSVGTRSSLADSPAFRSVRQRAPDAGVHFLFQPAPLMAAVHKARAAWFETQGAPATG